MNHNLFDLSGKVALITGGNTGLGLGFARGIAKCGGDIMIWGRNEDRNRQAAEEIAALGVRVMTAQVEISDDEAVTSAMQSAVDQMGRLDCVIANAGLTLSGPSMLELGADEFKSLIDINLNGAFYTIREGARQMMKRVESGDPGGSIIACGSLSVFCGVPSMAHYGASKAGMAALIKSAAIEFAPHGIRANMVALGLARTELLRNRMGEEMAAMVEAAFAEQNPIPRAATPEDVEGIAAYFASDASSYHTGDIVMLDGGRLAKI
ncbi:MAG: SDR family oxidoreductase [Pseudomonadales bacterium]|jgi:NAD(P)-dependent dehydrogenase (short-subunit alcohol dehydrogenase family)|nr:SDR family oxidoreductase [Pseudomonadales bacterium]MDP6472434.1 SDR family oxidoreductase [Pseudomonadales bacterium]MDP6828230.1 SDR family oxidoreductase [Pseudomonadales bacterium]MDP6971596.1 SDR family oxidoreductase [Pseudomonadales bacterium]|tara:strand:+ start:243 stop:1037 length:795 start_codon:yes stop_codon:yes gene_type:complete